MVQNPDDTGTEFNSYPSRNTSSAAAKYIPMALVSNNFASDSKSNLI